MSTSTVSVIMTSLLVILGGVSCDRRGEHALLDTIVVRPGCTEVHGELARTIRSQAGKSVMPLLSDLQRDASSMRFGPVGECPEEFSVLVLSMTANGMDTLVWDYRTDKQSGRETVMSLN